MKYDFKKLEKKWQKIWEKEGVYTAKNTGTKKKQYILVEFPYPSGEGLHMGHLRPYVAGDVMSRFSRMQGYEVMYPMGWDAFGLPAENFAIKRGIHPKITTARNIKNAKAQVKSWGISFDWSREVNTTDPAYYTWTQWIFLQFYKAGLAYESEGLINWCPKDKTGLANEEVIGGRCDRCGTLVEQKVVRQWYLKITAYAEKLLDGLKKLNWPEEIKAQQEHWIGKSEGAEIDFELTPSLQSGEIVFASNNKGKLKRMQKLVKAAGLSVVLRTPEEVGIKNFDVQETGATLEANAEKKVRALYKKTKLPILADDSGFFIKGDLLDPVKVKRNALKGLDEKKLTIEAIGNTMLKYYQSIADSYGGSVDAEWHNNLCLLTPDGKIRHCEAVRPVTLTNTPCGKMDPYLPLRPLYISKATGKHVLLQNEKEELLELEPITNALRDLVKPAIKVFTTRPDTLFGATYMVLAPEHSLIETLKGQVRNRAEVETYVKNCVKKTEEERTQNKEKTGVELKGIKAINPATQKEIPVWVADYVLSGYGTGAIMAVPAHDERDQAFAKKHHLPIIPVVQPVTGTPHGDDYEKESIVAIVRDPKHQKTLMLNWGPRKTNYGGTLFIGGSVDDKEDLLKAALREIKEETGYVDLKLMGQTDVPVNNYFYSNTKDRHIKAKIWGFLFDLQSDKQSAVRLDEGEKNKFNLEWVANDKVAGTVDDAGHKLIYDMLLQNAIYSGRGVLMNSDTFNGLGTAEARTSITKAFGKTKIQYHLRDWVFSRQRYWGEPIPLVHCMKCGIQPVPEKDLPVKLPSVKKYEPTGTGESPLAAVKNWVQTKCPKCKGPAKRETNTMPQWAGSSWYYLRYTDPKNRKQFASAKLLKRWLPVDMYFGGMEHTTLHLLYSRFWHLFLHDQNLVPTAEPYARRIPHGIILGPDGEKMSKSRGNVVNPDEVVARFGADTLRMYEMFLGPHGATVGWSDGGIVGIARFLERVWKVFQTQPVKASDTAVLQSLHRTIKKVGEDIEGIRFNTAISALMIFLNETETKPWDKNVRESFVKIIAPFAPHLAEELWYTVLGGKKSVHTAAWPAFDPRLVKTQTFTLIVQVNGKMRASIEAPADISEHDARALALSDSRVQELLGGNDPRRVIYVPGRLINIVV